MNQILYDKKDYQELLLEMLEPLRKWFSEGKARIRLSGTGAGYSGNIIEMEPLPGRFGGWYRFGQAAEEVKDGNRSIIRELRQGQIRSIRNIGDSAGIMISVL